MREIKFRGLRTDGKGWVYGYYFGGYNWADFIIEDAGFEHRVQVIPESVGQYTGLKDKNGKEIYEGDYIGMYGSRDKIEYWEYSKDGRLVKVNKYGKFTVDAILVNDSLQLEIIGNIHEQK